MNVDPDHSSNRAAAGSSTHSAILDALPAHIALVDSEGNIVEVNQSWRRFARLNDWKEAGTGVGENYIEVCRRATGQCSEEAEDAARGLEAVLRRDLQEFVLEYPCHSPDEKRWFRLMITPSARRITAGGRW